MRTTIRLAKEEEEKEDFIFHKKKYDIENKLDDSFEGNPMNIKKEEQIDETDEEEKGKDLEIEEIFHGSRETEKNQKSSPEEEIAEIEAPIPSTLRKPIARHFHPLLPAASLFPNTTKEENHLMTAARREAISRKYRRMLYSNTVRRRATTAVPSVLYSSTRQNYYHPYVTTPATGYHHRHQIMTSLLTPPPPQPSVYYKVRMPENTTTDVVKNTSTTPISVMNRFPPTLMVFSPERRPAPPPPPPFLTQLFSAPLSPSRRFQHSHHYHRRVYSDCEQCAIERI